MRRLEGSAAVLKATESQLPELDFNNCYAAACY